MRISRKFAAAAIAVVSAVAITACTPPSENPSDQKVDTAKSQDPDSLDKGSIGFEEKETSTQPTPVEPTAPATATSNSGDIVMGEQGFVVQQ
ncbi:hypothetical protein [Corynebacterium pilosum]|uniref:Secreted protein n=1 Tax=Corynebacterium pilosum TaxID=35756 RepID=A0A376CPD9_9CORY|nr:hypothetical protein [Corynebacterium pilosum]STC70077.1 Uncharacterised protein [Corynebacterium pilosum]